MGKQAVVRGVRVTVHMRLLRTVMTEEGALGSKLASQPGVLPKCWSNWSGRERSGR